MSQDVKTDFQKSIDFFRYNLQPHEIEWKIQAFGNWADRKTGKKMQLIVPYIKRQAVLNRLDKCFGVLGWQSKLIPRNAGSAGHGGCVCELSIWDEDSKRWITKSGMGGDSPVQQRVQGAEQNSIKGGASDAYKRAANNWGCGLDLADYPKIYVEPEKEGSKNIDKSIFPQLESISKKFNAGTKLGETVYLYIKK